MERVMAEPEALDRTRLRREIRMALELAVVALAPTPLVDRLASAAGLLEALDELPADAPPVRELAHSIVTRANDALEAWSAWRTARKMSEAA